MAVVNGLVSITAMTFNTHFEGSKQTDAQQGLNPALDSGMRKSTAQPSSLDENMLIHYLKDYECSLNACFCSPATSFLGCSPRL